MIEHDESGTTDRLLRVTDLKQCHYCPRVVYYQYCLPAIRPTTFKMEAGIEAQKQVETLETRRTLRAYGVTEGQRHFNVSLTSQRLGCSGRIDLVIETYQDGQPRLIPVDFKQSRRAPGAHFKLQLACYALMLEETWDIAAPVGYLYMIPARRAEPVPITARLRNQVMRKLDEIRSMIEQQIMPPPARSRRPCLDCEFRRFCNDRV